MQLQYHERAIATYNVEVQMSKHSKQHDNQQVVYMIHRKMNYSVSRLDFFTQMNFVPCKIALLGANTRVRCEKKIFWTTPRIVSSVKRRPVLVNVVYKDNIHGTGGDALIYYFDCPIERYIADICYLFLS